MIPLNPKIYLYAGAAILSALLVWRVASLPEHFREQGRQEILADVANKSREAILIRNAENERDKLAQSKINERIKADYEKSLADQKTDFDKRVAAINRDGGLRIAGKTCSERIAGTPNAGSPPSADEARDYRLPDDIEEGLFGLARKCQQVQTKLTTLQAWLVAHGFKTTED